MELSRVCGVARAKTASTYRYRCTKETVELRDWPVFGNRTVGIIRLTKVLPVAYQSIISFVFVKGSWNQVSELFVALRRVGRDAKNDIECPTRAIRTKRKLMGLTLSAAQ